MINKPLMKRMTSNPESHPLRPQRIHRVNSNSKRLKPSLTLKTRKYCRSKRRPRNMRFQWWRCLSPRSKRNSRSMKRWLKASLTVNLAYSQPPLDQSLEKAKSKLSVITIWSLRRMFSLNTLSLLLTKKRAFSRPSSKRIPNSIFWSVWMKIFSRARSRDHSAAIWKKSKTSYSNTSTSLMLSSFSTVVSLTRTQLWLRKTLWSLLNNVLYCQALYSTSRLLPSASMKPLSEPISTSLAVRNLCSDTSSSRSLSVSHHSSRRASMRRPLSVRL